MPTTRVSLPQALVADVAPTWQALREELGVPDAFSPEALADAEAAARAPRMPELDRTDLSLLTIDPEGSRDLDQALAIERRSGGRGYRVHYAIADVAAFVTPGGALDAEAHRRGVTLYGPDRDVPLHPEVLSAGAASLLPDQIRPALLWTMDLDVDGGLVSTDVRRARVRSRRQMAYPEVQALLNADMADDDLAVLREVGRLRQAVAAARGAVHLPTPEQEVADGADGRPCLVFRAPLPTEAWNAEISLLTGVAAAALMLEGDVGLLRTLPPPDPREVASLRLSALALGIAWPEKASYAEVISALDPQVPEAAALLTFAARLLRGAAYTAFDGAPPEQPVHSAVASPYAHCTAPLRRLADRHVGEICLAVAAGREVPDWARSALPVLPEEMTGAIRRSQAFERAVVDLAEAVVLAPRAGEVFDAVVVESGESRGVVQLRDPAVRARCEGADLPLGETLRVRLAEVDVAARKVTFPPGIGLISGLPGHAVTRMPGRQGDSGVTVVMPRPSRLRALAIAGLVVVAALAGAGRLGNLLPSLPNPFGSDTVDRTSPALLQSLADLSDYHAATGNFQVIVDTEKDTRFVPSVIRGERTVFVAAGSVDAVVDFSGLDERSIQVSPDRTSATIVLPAPTLAEPTVDPKQSRVVSRDRGVLDRIGSAFSDNPTSERPLVLAAQEKMREAAAESDLRRRAEDNTRRMLEGMLRALGYTSVTVSFSPSPA